MATNNAINNTLATPFTVGATSVTSTGTQLNLLNGSTVVPFNKITIQRITATGAFTYTPTTGCVYAIFRLWGAGASGGGQAAGSGAASGGASGSYLEIIATAAQIAAAAVTGTIGTGGAAPSAGNNNGNNGGNSTILFNSSTWTAAGGLAGTGSASVTAQVLAGGAAVANTVGSNATLIQNILGQAGGYGVSLTAGSYFQAGAGGNAPMGEGFSIQPPNIVVVEAFNGIAGSGNAAGGTGSASVGAGAAAGGAGANGILIITEYLNA